jgi:hypothetical protein
MPNFFTAPDLRAEPGRSRLNLLICAASVCVLCLLSTVAHTERPVVVAMQRDRAQVLRASVFSIRTAQAATGELVSKLGRMLGRMR